MSRFLHWILYYEVLSNNKNQSIKANFILSTRAIVKHPQDLTILVFFLNDSLKKFQPLHPTRKRHLEYTLPTVFISRCSKITRYKALALGITLHDYFVDKLFNQISGKY